MNHESAKNGILHCTGSKILNLNSCFSILEKTATEEQKVIIAMAKTTMLELQETIQFFDDNFSNQPK